jgi:hypothetical protein
MKTLFLTLVFVLLATPAFALSTGADANYVNDKISEVESMANQYQTLVLNLNSQGAYASKSIKLLSDMKDLLWQAKLSLAQGMLNDADKALEDAKSIAPRITLDVAFSIKINRGRLALEEALSLIDRARRDGYEVAGLQSQYDRASLLFKEAKSSYESESYDEVEPKIVEILDTVEAISQQFDTLKTPQKQQSTTGFAISYPSFDLSGWWILVVAVLIVGLVLGLRRRNRKLSKFSRLEIIKNRLR